jgi:hypothetical protein
MSYRSPPIFINLAPSGKSERLSDPSIISRPHTVDHKYFVLSSHHESNSSAFASAHPPLRSKTPDAEDIPKTRSSRLQIFGPHVSSAAVVYPRLRREDMSFLSLRKNRGTVGREATRHHTRDILATSLGMSLRGIKRCAKTVNLLSAPGTVSPPPFSRVRSASCTIST